jgi:hypothetical protein
VLHASQVVGEMMVKHTGSCHCGAVKFVVEADEDIVADRCNCSICAMCGFIHLISPASKFHLLEGKDDLVDYRFNSGVARHLFCRHCGVKSFYVPRSNPDGYSINVNCLDPATIKSLEILEFDGQNWEDNAERLVNLSKEPEE